MDIETKIALGFLFTFVAGLIMGWYATWQTYHQNKKRHEAFTKGLQYQHQTRATMKVTIDIEQYDNGISLKWNDSEGHKPESIVTLDRDKESVIGKMIWDDIKSAMDVALTNTVRMEIDYLVYFDEEKA